MRDGLGKIAEDQNEKLFITSFNGDYVGYITYDEHYGHSEQEEVMAMNWVGPYYGKYYSEIIKKILSKKLNRKDARTQRNLSRRLSFEEFLSTAHVVLGFY